MRRRTSPLNEIALGLAGGLAGGLVGYAWHRIARRSRATRRYRELANGRVSGARVLIVGGGFAGLTAAVAIGRAGLASTEVVPTLVDRNNYNSWSPLLYQVVTGSVDPSRAEYPLRLAARDHGFLFRQGALTGVDLDRRIVHLADSDLEYDYLVLALGSVPNYYGMEDVARQALPLKWGGNAVAIHNRVIGAFERADVEPDARRRRELLTIVVVGAGATGLGLIGSLYDLIRETLLPQYPRLDSSEVSLVLVEARDHFLEGSPRRMSDLARQILGRRRGPAIDVRLGASVVGLDSPTLLFADGSKLRAATIVWTAGVRASPLADSLDVERARDGRLLVNPNLELPGHPEVYVVGDLACLVDPATGQPTPLNAQFALQSGRAAAANVVRRIHGASARPFRYRPLGDAVWLGAGQAVAELGGFVFDGLPAHLIRRSIYMINLIGVKNRLGVLLDWAAEATGRRNTVEFEGPRPATAGIFAEEVGTTGRGQARPSTEFISEPSPTEKHDDERRAA